MSSPAPVTVELVRLVDENVYVLESQPWDVQLEVDGMPVKAPAVLSDPSRLKRVVPAHQRLVGYASSDGTMPVEEFNARRTLLLQKADEDDVFLNIDDEYAYKKFMATWNPVLETVPGHTEPIDFKVVEIRRDSGDPDIKSLWNDSALPDQRKLYRLSRLYVADKTLRQLAAKHGLMLEIPNHSGIRFAKIDGAYAYDDSMDFTKSVNFIGTLEQCKAEKARIVDLVARPVTAAVAKKRGLALRRSTAAEVREQIHRACGFIRPMVLKQSSGGSKFQALTALQDALAAIDQQLAEEVQS